MLVYGDRCEIVDTSARIAELMAQAQAVDSSADDCTARASVCTRLLVDVGCLVQGLLDAAFRDDGQDDVTLYSEACHDLLLAAGRVFLARADDRFARGRAQFLAGLDRLQGTPLPSDVLVRTPEGYAHYALYPELYENAALDYRARRAHPLFVIGIRSIGTSLAAVIAAGSGSPAGLATVRPVGHPFYRRVAIGSALAARVRGLPPHTHFAIVDEGPGASGSSFLSVVDWLDSRGIALERVHLFPSHSGAPGPKASARARALWARIECYSTEFETYFVRNEGSRESAFAGPHGSYGIIPTAAMGSTELAIGSTRMDSGTRDFEQLAPGAWRAKHALPRAAWPPCFLQQERRKALYEQNGRRRLARFAGLGRYGDRAFDMARLLASKGFIPAVRDDAHVLSVVPAFDRGALLDTVIRYLTFRATALGSHVSGASPRELFDMALCNTTERLGADCAQSIRHFEAELGAYEARALPIASDNRMHRWEWLVLPDGRLLKTDALDHHAAHDCIGSQDLAWDLAGAAVELDLTDAEIDALREDLARHTRFRPAPRREAFYALCYLAFQLGYAVEGAAATAFDATEASRLDRAADSYANKLKSLLSALP